MFHVLGYKSVRCTYFPVGLCMPLAHVSHAQYWSTSPLMCWLSIAWILWLVDQPPCFSAQHCKWSTYSGSYSDSLTRLGLFFQILILLIDSQGLPYPFVLRFLGCGSLLHLSTDNSVLCCHGIPPPYRGRALFNYLPLDWRLAWRRTNFGTLTICRQLCFIWKLKSVDYFLGY